MKNVLRCWSALAASLLILGGIGPGHAQPEDPLAFQLTFDPAITSGQPFTGRVYVMLSKKAPPLALRSGFSWFQPEPILARDVKGWKPGDPLLIGPDSSGYPVVLPKLEPGTYHVQAVMDLDQGHISFTTAPGNGYSKAVSHKLDPKMGGPIVLKLDQVYQESAFKETDRVKLVEIDSPLLTAFHRRPTRLRAGVVLPASFADNPQRRYPIIYEIPGFSGTHRGAFGAALRKATDVAGVEMLYVMLDPSCRLGHSVFADSANNGPCGRALIEELIPAIEQRYRALGSPATRFVTGHSSGGWSSLWLQVAYPDHFGGVWSTAPDPVDFRDFQRVNIYEDANVFSDAAGKARPIARRNKQPVLFFKGFSDMEEVMGHGGQLGSFEAVFSPRGPDGRPLPLWDRQTGAIDPQVARTWEQFDIRLVLERGWQALAPRLAGKLHVYMGEEDTFYLEGATRRLGESLRRLGSDAVVELFPGKDHGSLMTSELRGRIQKEMAAAYRRSLRAEEP
jgi:hypothetical protein